MAKAINSPYYWTYEKCKEEVDKYLILKEFRKKAKQTYNKILRMKWYVLLKNLKRERNLKYDDCIMEVNKYTKLKEFRKNSPLIYDKIKKMKWNELLENLERSNKNWNFDECRKIASICITKSEFRKSYTSAYEYAYRNNFLDDICSHMTPLGNKYIRMVYAYEFNLNNEKYAYIGITCNEKRRKTEHLSKNSDSPVNKFMIENNISDYTYIKISDYI